MITNYKIFEGTLSEFEQFPKLCEPFITEMKEIFPTKEKFIRLYRSIREVKKDSFIYDRIYGRFPSSTPEHLHYIFDDVFYKIFKWAARSEGVFTTSDVHTSSNYGESLLFFPIGSYRYVYAPEIHDLYSEIDIIEDTTFFKIKDEYNTESDESVIEFIADNREVYEDAMYEVVYSLIKSNYKDNDLETAIIKGVETTFDCDQYYLFPQEYSDKILSIIYD